MLKAIIDTNIWISALMKSSLTRPILEAFIQSKFVPIISDKLLKELNDTLNEPEVIELINTDEAKELITLINSKSERFNPTAEVNICRDSKDNFILSLLRESEMPLISLDKDLLVLSNKAKEFNILTPKEFLEQLRK
jgi:putative PIN family toxin of toxin-antitoxin system